MTAKEYLRQVRTAQSAMERARSESYVLMTQATKITTSMSAAGGGGDGRKIENAAIRLAELADELEKEAQHYTAVVDEVLHTVNQIGEPYATLLFLRYFAGKTWEKVAVEMNYSWRHVHRVHADALKKIDGIVCHTESML